LVIVDRNDLFDHLAGAIFGLAIGDALGAITEGMNPASIADKYGQITGFRSQKQIGTDDTEFTLFYIELLQKYGLEISAETIARHWLEDIYHPSETYKGAGFSEAMTLRNLKQGLLPPESGQHVHSWSDGLAMCATSFGCVYPGQPGKAADLTKVFGSVSHNGEGIYGGIAVAAAVSSAIIDSDWEKIIQSALEFIPKECWVYYSIKNAVEIGKSCDSVQSAITPLYEQCVYDYYYWTDLAPEAVGLAFGLLVAARGNFQEAVLGAVNLGRDADTIAAIAGAICGAKKAYKSIPQKLLMNIDSVPGQCIRSMAGKKIINAVNVLVDLAFKDNRGI